MSYSLNALRAFESAARHLSFKMAAEELNLTPTAISHQIRGLEATLGLRLFDRQVRRVTLTSDGAEFARALAPAFAAIEQAVVTCRSKLRRPTVTVGAGPLLASRWLVPRLGTFWDMHPNIDLRLHYSPVPVHQQLTRYDLAIAWGKGGWPGVDAHLFLRIDTTPVHAPNASFGFKSGENPEALLDRPLLHYRDFDDWRQWLIDAGADAPADLPGAVFDDANVLVQAALEGQGIALGYLPLVADELLLGRLVAPWTLKSASSSAYYLTAAEPSRLQPPVQAVLDWLSSIRQTNG